MNETNQSTFIDANILVYAFDSSEKRKHELARKHITQVLLKQKHATISTQILGEFFNVVTRKIEHPLPVGEAHEIVCKLTELENLHIANIGAATVIQAIELSDSAKTSYWDALIAATMKEHQVSVILTENVKDFSRIPGIVVTNPFAEKN